MQASSTQDFISEHTLLQAIVFVLFASFFIAKIAIPLAKRWNLVDAPDHRKEHEGAIPLVGGIALGIAMMLGMFLFLMPSPKLLVMLLAGVGLLLIGVLDDYCNLGVRLRIVAQLAAIFAVIAGSDLTIHHIGKIGEVSIDLGWFAVPFTILAVIGLTNAFNLIDGIDGLAGSLTLVAIIGIFAFQAVNNNFKTTTHLILLAAALIPYLYFNVFSRTKIFMGDAGSTFIGFVIAWTLINLSQDGVKTISPGAALWCVALPVIDTLGVMGRRILKRQSPFKPDRNHLHHILIRAGFSPRESLVVLVSFALVLLLVGLVLEYTVSWLSALAFLGSTVLYIALIRHAWRLQRFLKRKHQAVAHESTGN
jgi:UDP-GlcNAc:undecaprenyl-phosphate GlcNAc-1-phosphate transferase